LTDILSLRVVRPTVTGPQELAKSVGYVTVRGLERLLGHLGDRRVPVTLTQTTRNVGIVVRVLGLDALRFRLLLLGRFRHGRRLAVVHATVLRTGHTLVTTFRTLRRGALTGSLGGRAGTL